MMFVYILKIVISLLRKYFFIIKYFSFFDNTYFPLPPPKDAEMMPSL